MSVENHVSQALAKLHSEGIVISGEDLMLSEGDRLLKEHGPNPATKAQAAANSAAVLVAAAALGVNYAPVAQIIQNPETKHWRAEVAFSVCTAEDSAPGKTTPSEVAKAACMYASGFAGEMFTDHGHQLSETYNLAKSAFFTSKIDLEIGTEETALATYWPRVINLTQEILAYNEDVFTTLYQAFLDNEGIGAASLQTVLAQVKPVNINQISGRVH